MTAGRAFSAASAAILFSAAMPALAEWHQIDVPGDVNSSIAAVQADGYTFGLRCEGKLIASLLTPEPMDDVEWALLEKTPAEIGVIVDKTEAFKISATFERIDGKMRASGSATADLVSALASAKATAEVAIMTRGNPAPGRIITFTMEGAKGAIEEIEARCLS